MDFSDRPRYHFRPQKGCMNDPNGLVFFDGWYHVFFQHYPHTDKLFSEPAHWGHARTKDFLHWEELPFALVPDAPYDDGGCWSGTACVYEGRLYLAYASVHVPPGERRRETVSIAWSDDGVHFTKYAQNPVIDRYPPQAGPDFRDPAIARIGDGFACLMASGSPQRGTAQLLLYESGDLLHWQYRGIAREWADAVYAECPSLVPLPDGSVLASTSIARPGGHAFAVAAGELRGGRFLPRTEGSPERGPDGYAGQIFRDPRGRLLLISWLPGLNFTGHDEHNVSCLSVPHELTVKNGRICAYPVEEVRSLLRREDPALTRTANGFTVARQGREPVVHTGRIDDLCLIRDGYILEVFVNGGETVYSILL